MLIGFPISAVAERQLGFVLPRITMLWRQLIWRIMRAMQMIRFCLGNFHLGWGVRLRQKYIRKAGITLRKARAGRCSGALCTRFVSSERGELMARGSHPDLFVTESQSDLFGAEAAPAYRPMPTRCARDCIKYLPRRGRRKRRRGSRRVFRSIVPFSRR